MNALSELKRLPETKEQTKTFAYAVINEIMDGEVNAVEVEVRLKMIEDTIKLIRTDVRIKNLLLELVEGGDNQYMGATLKLKQRKTMSFKNDPIWNSLKGKLKARETLLKQTRGVDPETGEIVGIDNYSEFIEIKY